MKFEETPRGFRLSFGKQTSDLQNLKNHFFLGFLSSTGIALCVASIAIDIGNNRSWWSSALLLALCSVNAFSTWRIARNEWKRAKSRYEPAPTPTEIPAL